MPDGAGEAMVAEQDPAPDWKAAPRQIHKTRGPGWGADPGVEQQAHRRDPEVKAGAPALRLTGRRFAAETMRFAPTVERHVPATAGAPDLDAAEVRRLASRTRPAGPVRVFKAEPGDRWAGALASDAGL